jgi:hypothetical protein
MPVAVLADRGYWSSDADQTCRKFGTIAYSRFKHEYYGNSWNLLLGCREFLSCTYADVFHLIEDDTLVHRGYFAWAIETLCARENQTFKYAAVCARIDSPHITNWYESPCASWNAAFLRRALDHVVPEYFSSDRLVMQRALDEKMFPASAYKKGGAEQDGFFLRCIEHHGWKTKFPPKPLATHLGWWGYNSPPGRERPIGSFEDRIAQCRAMLTNRQRRNELFGHRITEAEMSGWDGGIC